MSSGPKNIVLLKGHSAGVGDLLRGSAAWSALLDHYPGTRLHLAFVSQEPGYASEEFIRRHHLLQTLHVHPKWRNTPENWRQAIQWLTRVIHETRSEMLIDFEAHGLRSLALCSAARLRTGIHTVGIADWPGRGLFYNRAAPSRRRYAAQLGLPRPLEYTERDFVALAALGIHRGNRPIELQETPEAVALRRSVRERLSIPEGVPIVGINIGCGTPGADCRRPDSGLIERLIVWLQDTYGCAVVLTGAPFESETNQRILERLAGMPGPPRIDGAGKTRLIELPGLIRACDLFVSADSGPYHISVGLRAPTVALFNFEHPVAVHRHPWVRCVVCPGLEGLPHIQTAVQSLRDAYPWGGIHDSQ
jgi:ADP-heptose:LPS heptosyltransferase